MAMPFRSVLAPGSLPLSFIVKDVEPKDDPRWILASSTDRQRFWTLVGSIAQEVKQRELTAGLDYAGRKLRPVRLRKLKYKSGRILDGEPLMPHRALSRTRRLLRYIVNRSQVTFFWAMDWGRILDYHRRGAVIVRGGKPVGRLPVRNVFGISPQGQKEIAQRALQLWLSGLEHKKAPHPLMPQQGLSVAIPFDPVRKPPKTVEDWLALGVRATLSTAKVRVVNTQTGIPGAAPSRVKIQTNWKGWKP